MRFIPVILFCIGLVCACRGAIAADFPRVSGIVGQEGAWVIAIIETDNGKCAVISRGDAYGSGIVSDITAQGVEVRYPDRREFLPLKGGTFVAMGETESTQPASILPRTTAHTISREEIVAALAQTEKRLSAEKGPSLNEVLGLPLAAQIAAVNSAAIATPQEAGRILHEELKKGHIPRINVIGVPGLSEIYLVPDKPFIPAPLPENMPTPTSE